MYITYHKEIKKPDELFALIPHKCLHEDIQNFIEENKCKQADYYIDGNMYYLFIYLNNGDRIDVSLK